MLFIEYGYLFPYGKTGGAWSWIFISIWFQGMDVHLLQRARWMLFNDADGQVYFFTGILFAVNNKELIDKFIYVCGPKEHDDSDKINRRRAK